jgi:hypothetical protein
MFFDDQAPGSSSEYPCIGTRVLCTILQLVLFPTSFIAYSFMVKSDHDRHAKIYLNMSPATLTRRLKAEGTTYQKEKVILQIRLWAALILERLSTVSASAQNRRFTTPGWIFS